METMMISQSERPFFNINFVDSKEITNEYLKRSGAGLFVDKTWQGNSQQQSLLGYIQPSPGLNSLKKTLLNESPFEFLDLGIDPFSLSLWQSQLSKMELDKEAIQKSLEKNDRFFRLSGQAYKMSGAEDFQELAILLASICELEDQFSGLVSAEDLWQVLSLEITLTPHLFQSLSKIRAIKMMLTRWCEMLDRPPVSLPLIFGIPSLRHMSCREPWTNLLRMTAMQSAALMGGANGFVSIPFDFLSNHEGGRITRNSLEVLMQESHLLKAQDPSFGSSYGEAQCQELCEKSWILFVEILKKGGLVDCLRSGWLHDIINKSEAEETAQVCSRKKVLTGVNQFALVDSLSEQFPLVEKNQAIDLESLWVNYVDLENAKKLCDVERLVPKGLAQHFEHWQFRGDQIKKQDPGRVKVGVLIENLECRTKKWNSLARTLELAGLEAVALEDGQETSCGLIFLLASDPQGEFAKESLEKIKQNPQNKMFWYGERSISGFDGHLGENSNLMDAFAKIFEVLEGKRA